MKAKIKVTKEVDVRFIKLDVGVGYWEDAEVNGERDVDMYECKGNAAPRMPFSVKVKDNPNTNIYSDHWRWQPTIDVERGCIVGWPKGTTARVHYKVCDEGIYHLLDPMKNIIVSIESYVPDCIGEYGDYIVMHIDEDGKIDGFNFTEGDVKEIIKSDFNYEED